MSEIHWIQINGEELAVKQQGTNFRVIHPWKNKDGSMNWFNLLTGGSWINVIATAAIVALILGVTYEYSTNINRLLDCFRVPGLLETCKDTFGANNPRLNLLR